MKLATALSERADLQRRINELSYYLLSTDLRGRDVGK